jgi:phenylacetate-coenzyme A ligase PaaK-like adenylate-forming protein
VIDPVTERAVPEGALGEVVVTTLSRRAMPLVRYRTGDLSRFLPGPCACGTALRRLERVRGRRGEVSLLRDEVTIATLDEALFEVPALVDFTATARRSERATQVDIRAWSVRQDQRATEQAVAGALDAVPAIRAARSAGELSLAVDCAFAAGRLPRGPEKRAITELSGSA